MGESILSILWVVWTVALLILYHKVFAVYYFDLGNGLLKELVGAAILGAVMAALTITYWYVSAIIIIVIGLMVCGKVNNKIPLVIAVIFAVFIAIVGASVKTDTDTSSVRIEIVAEKDCV